MVYGPRRCATCSGSRSSYPRVACTFTALKAVFPAYIQSAVTRCERCVSCVVITPKTPTYSFPSAAGLSAPSVSTASSSASARPPRCHSRSTHTCFAMPAGLSWPTMATTPGPCSTTSGTRTSSTRSGTPKWRPTGSKAFGGTDDSGCSPRAGTPLRQIVRSRVHWRWHTLPRLALLRRNRGVDVFEQPVRTFVLGLLKLGWTQHSNGFRSALDDRSARRSPALQHLLNEVDARL